MLAEAMAQKQDGTVRPAALHRVALRLYKKKLDTYGHQGSILMENIEKRMRPPTEEAEEV